MAVARVIRRCRGVANDCELQKGEPQERRAVEVGSFAVERAFVQAERDV